MSQKNKYIIVTWYNDESSDYPSQWSFETLHEFVTDSQLNDITKLMKQFGIRQWVNDPETITEANWRQGDGSLIEFRNVLIKPIKVVEEWSYASEVAR